MLIGCGKYPRDPGAVRVEADKDLDDDGHELDGPRLAETRWGLSAGVWAAYKGLSQPFLVLGEWWRTSV